MSIAGIRSATDHFEGLASGVERARIARTIRFVGNVVTQPFGKAAAAVEEWCDLTCVHEDFGQVVQALKTTSGEDYLAIHLDHRWFFDVVADEGAVARARELADHVRHWLQASTGIAILNTVTAPLFSSVDGDRYDQVERVAAINSVLFSLAKENSRVRIVDVADMVLRLGWDAVWRERNRYVMQHPYSPAAVVRLVEAYARTIRLDSRARRKVVVVDADNTLWGGVLGEDGPDGVVVDQEYPGIAYHVFQQQLVHLRRLGHLLVAVTKNNESDFLELFQLRSMPLALTDFVTYRSNWKEKSENIADVAAELNLGLDSFVFFDDNPFEIEEVRAHLPDVECWLFPKNAPDQAMTILANVESLQTASVTAEDLAKTEQYRTEAERDASKNAATNLEDYLQSLDIEVAVSVNDPSHIGRVAQLTNKTNQFNLTTRRYTESDIAAFMKKGAVYDFRVKDRFGDLGLVGVVIVVDGEIDTFLMSCRALGRKIEAGMLRFVVDHASSPLRASYRRTAKNDMVSRFFDQNGFATVSMSEEEHHYLMNEGPEKIGHVRFVER